MHCLALLRTVLGLTVMCSSSDCVWHPSTCSAKCCKEMLMGPPSWEEEEQREIKKKKSGKLLIR